VERRERKVGGRPKKILDCHREKKRCGLMAEEGEGSRKFVVFRINRLGKKKLGTPPPRSPPLFGFPIHRPLQAATAL
jgi:hypothetical protein